MSKSSNTQKSAAKTAPEGTQAEEIQLSEELLKAGQTGFEKTEFAEVFDEDIGALMVGKAPMDKAGYRIRATLLGVRRIFSDKFKKTGKTMTYNGKQHLYRDKIELKDANGILFSVWATGFLLQEIGKIPYNALVEITYNGKEIKETARGPQESHDFTVRVGKGVVVDRYAKGIQNWLNSPVPESDSSDDSADLVNFMNYQNAIAKGQIAGVLKNDTKLLAQ